MSVMLRRGKLRPGSSHWIQRQRLLTWPWPGWAAKGRGWGRSLPQGLDMERGSGPRPPRLENSRILAAKRLREEVPLRKNFCFQMGET